MGIKLHRIIRVSATRGIDFAQRPQMWRIITPSTHLINPNKPEIGRISKAILYGVKRQLKQELNQCANTAEAMTELKYRKQKINVRLYSPTS